MPRYRYRGRFISAGEAARFANLRGAKDYLTTEVVEQKRVTYKTTGFYRSEEVEERRAIAEERAAPPPTPAPSVDYYEPPEAPYTPPEAPPAETPDYYDPDIPYADQELFGLEPLVDEPMWMEELFDDDLDEYLDDVDDEGEDYPENGGG